MNLKYPKFRLTIAAALAIVSFSAPAFATTMYGSLGNFDIINDTGQTAHGFEIELDGCLPSNVFSTFGSPYNRYGTPTITTDGTNTFVRYESAFNGGAWAVGTSSGTYAPTGGHSLFFPQAVALVGATDREGSVGRTVLRNLISNPFGGTIYPINPKRPNVLGIRSYPSVKAVPQQVDMAVICTPAATIPAIVRELVECRVPTAIIISAHTRRKRPQ
jgi:hypothetical protein